MTYAQDATTIKATELIKGFSLLYNSEAGKTVLEQNMETAIGINNNADPALRERGIKDNTIAALVGSISNGLLVSNALGSKMGGIYAANNSIDAASYSASTFSPQVEALFTQVNALILEESAFAKNFYANGSVHGDPAEQAEGIALPEGGQFNIYDLAYQPSEADKNDIGNSRPPQVWPDQIQTFTAEDFFGVETDTAVDIIPTLKGNAAFPSGHTAFGYSATSLFAQMIPERYQEMLLRGAEYGNSRVVVGAHHPLDVIGARIMTTYTLAQILNNHPEYLNRTLAPLGTPTTTTDDFQRLLLSAQADLRQLLEQGCGESITTCAAADKPSTEEMARRKEAYRHSLTYGFDPVGPTNLAPVVPEGAEVLIATRFPYLTAEQRREVLATTEIESGHALDDGSGWARLNLYDAADGYGAFHGDVHVSMDASRGGFNAYDSWNNDIAGEGRFVKSGSGILEFTGNNSFTGTTTIAGGGLIINGYHGDSAVTVDKGAMLGGSGTVGTLTSNSGALIAPGNSIGTMSVNGDVTFNPDSIYAVEVDSKGNSDLIQASGSAVLNGGQVNVSLEDRGNLLSAEEVHSLLGQEYSILTAEQGISGTFDNVQPSYLFVGTQLDYADNSVTLDVTRNATAFTDVADSDNQREVAAAIEALGAGNAVYESLLESDSAMQARSAFSQLSGQVHADIASAQLNDSRYLRDAMNGRMRQAEGLTSATDIQSTKGGSWGQILGAWDHASSDGNATGYDASTYGFLLGWDTTVGSGWDLGIAGGYTRTDLDGGHDASADSDNYHLGIYAGKRFGDIFLRGGSAYTWNRIETSRSMRYGDQSASASDKYSGRTAQVFAEAASRFTTGSVNLEPFANLAYVNFDSNEIDEKGGATALHGDEQVMDTTMSTLGLRADTQWKVSPTASVALRGELGWQHQLDDLERGKELMFTGSSESFTVDTVPASRDGAVMKLGTDVSIRDDTTLSLSYGGLWSEDYQDNSVNASVKWRF
ncbi:autotransporter outer membrane beta-barrel domain-containing protein [Halomonas binhaiensis]|uniref:Autotransporter outer membrane beta-barrel domain-containing protein n=1 Tax=Halomonas binhaiensis TaxID=2562282 RepID=A0A856QVV9_9GAMM|nr:autotransporter outer membrane beta-barrel domain-containing protein [Halomonas binhaiensis]QEM84015.2 autotransporter outer membrane beta-barrel domain-containing protein [Halomonas binhaiensis]